MTATVVVLRVVVRRAHRVTRRRRWRWRWRCRQLHGASSALRVTHTARHASVCARHRRASRASSPFPSPRARPARVRNGGARSLNRSRTRCGVGDGDGDSGRLRRASRASRALHVTRADAHVITMRGARHCRFPPPRARPARALCGGGGACSIARTRCGVGIGGGGGGRLHRTSRASCASRKRTHTHAHAIAVFRSPLARPERAR